MQMKPTRRRCRVVAGARINNRRQYEIHLTFSSVCSGVWRDVGLETKKEVGVICFFHLLGVSMEIFKVSHGAWTYPDDGFSKVMGVPLYSGFMYASVAQK